MTNRSEIFNLPKSIYIDEATSVEAFTFDYLKYAFWLYRNRILNLCDIRAKEAPSWLLCTGTDAASYHEGLKRICVKYEASEKAGKCLIDFLDYIHSQIPLEEVAVRTKALILNFNTWELELVHGDEYHLAFETRCVYY